MSPIQVFAAIVCFFLLAVVFSLIVKRLALVRTLDDFLVAGGKMKWPLTTGILISIYIYVASIMGSAESGWWYGAPGMWMYGTYALGLVAVSLVIHRFKRISETLHVYSITEFMSQRLKDSKTVVLFTVLVFLASWLCTLNNLIGGGYVVSGISLNAVPYWLGVLTLAGITIFYVWWEGTWSSALIQWAAAVLISVGLIVSLLYTYAGIPGGAMTIISAAENIRQSQQEILNPFAKSASWHFLPAAALYCITALATQEWYQPGVSSSPKKLQWAYWLAAAWFFVVCGIAGTMGFIGYTLVKSGYIPSPAAPSEIYPHLVTIYAPQWVKYLMLFLVYGAGSGSIAITLIVQATIVHGYTKLGKSSLRLVMLGTLLTAVIIGTVVRPSLLELEIFLCCIVTSAGIPLVLSMYWSKVNPNGVFTGVALGFIAMLYFFFLKQYGLAQILAAALGGGVTVAWSIVAPREFNITEMLRPDLNLPERAG